MTNHIVILSEAKNLGFFKKCIIAIVPSSLRLGLSLEHSDNTAGRDNNPSAADSALSDPIHRELLD